MKALTSNRETVHGIRDGKLAKKNEEKRKGMVRHRLGLAICHPRLPSQLHDTRRDSPMPTMREMMKLHCLKLVPYKTSVKTQKVAFQFNNDFEATLRSCTKTEKVIVVHYGITSPPPRRVA
jgi:hypothetical protein